MNSQSNAQKIKIYISINFAALHKLSYVNFVFLVESLSQNFFQRLNLQLTKDGASFKNINF